MAGLIEKVSAVIRNAKTYHLGLLQTKAYRILKQRTGELLEHLDISSTEWAFLGLLYDHPKGLRASDAAEELGVEAPFVTVLIKKFHTRGFVETHEDKTDNRAKQVSLTPRGHTFVNETESYLRGKMRALVHGATANDIATYASVLEKIIHNGQKEPS